ncbi:hypothetical protein BDV36DRAFT_279758 [Aspergillus pseudocaelatus]|uniref:Zn(2)-C6 fungal-type domain-containing protein n=1 Tax=Aspergillus pseudocaelatus TaxID=1825620 RepID=A0ABQ6WZW8_9EURO|nr:hypothetical protein BDV36DRAFT_279758 [Aspergillus pseudocaelatus]
MAGQSAPASERSSPDRGVHKRVCKACDRCRLKKSRCDGAKPCSRCRAGNTLCVLSERKKTRDKVYPRGYVEMLEQQQTWLVNGLQELYRRLLEGDGWQGEPLEREANGQPLIHDLLTQLGTVDQSKHERLEESTDSMQQALWKNGAGHMQRQDTSDTSSESAHSPVMPPLFSDLFAARIVPQTFPTSSINLPQLTSTSELHRTPNNPAAQLKDTQWPSPGFGSFDDIDIMCAQYSGTPYDNFITLPMFNL